MCTISTSTVHLLCFCNSSQLELIEITAESADKLYVFNNRPVVDFEGGELGWHVERLVQKDSLKEMIILAIEIFERRC